MTFAPVVYRWAAIAAVGLSLFGYGWLKGSAAGERKLHEAQAKALTEGARIVLVRGGVTKRIETKYVPQIERSNVITETIIKEVPVYVKETDTPMPGGFRLLHDAAARGVPVPGPASIADAAVVPAQDVAATVAANYGTCREDHLKVQGFQEWVREQQKVK